MTERRHALLRRGAPDSEESDVSTILVVDDYDLARMRIREALTGAGHLVIEASDGQEAVSFFRSTQPDAVLLDAAMPVMSGLETLRVIREINPDAKIVMLTGYADKSSVLEARDNGATDYILKPYSNERLLTAVNRIVGP